MILWLDNQLPPALASWMRASCDVECVPVRALDLQRASDIDIFLPARGAGAVVMTKDADFAALVGQHGSPPQVVLITCGSTSNARLREVVQSGWAAVRVMLERGEPLVELGEPPHSRAALLRVLATDWRASTCVSQRRSWFQLALFWSTNMPKLFLINNLNRYVRRRVLSVALSAEAFP